MSSRGCALPKLWLLALAFAGAALAADFDAMVVSVSVNQQARGEFTVYRDPSGDYYASPADLAALGLADSGVEGRREQIDGETRVSLRSLGAVSLVLDEARLALDITFPTPRLQGRSYDLVPRRLEKVFQPREQA